LFKEHEHQMDAEDYYDAGAELFFQGLYHEVIAMYSKALEICPSRADILSDRGNAYSNLGDLQHAVEDYNRSLAIDPHDAIAYCNRGLAVSRLGGHDGAINDCGQDVRPCPQNATVLDGPGNAPTEPSALDQPTGDCVEAARPGQFDLHAHINLSIDLIEKCEIVPALRHCDHALGLDSGCADAYVLRAYIYHLMGLDGLMKRDFTKAEGLLKSKSWEGTA
jgi:tetratricopeptide (TPR) repeat protein